MKKKYPKKTIFSPKIWMGMDLMTWLKVLKDGHYKVGFCCLHAAIIISISSILNTIQMLVEKLFFSKKIASTKIKSHPIFIIGHWRSGTTLLHELLSLDKRYGYPNTYQCIFPGHFLMTEFFSGKIMNIFMPKTRPMDAMPVGSKRPQEDEFALCNLGAVSPYRGITFPEELENCAKYLRISDLPKNDQDEWINILLGFFKKLTYRTQKQLIIKSPTHSFRVNILMKLFPDAKFIHIKRNPYSVYKSTQHLWMTLLDKQGLQRVDPEMINNYIKNNFIALNQAIIEDTESLTDNQYYELSYEELVENPLVILEQLYRTLHMGDFNQVYKCIESYQEKHKDYKTNEYSLSKREITEINSSWGYWIKQQGYKIRKT